MKLITPLGTVKEYKVGQAICGIAIRSVILEAKDVEILLTMPQDKLQDFLERIHTRLH
jgi:hypothetical protein